MLQVALAQQIYDYVDQRIRRLDKDIKVFDGVIAKQRSLLGLPVCLLPGSFPASLADCFRITDLCKSP